MESSLAQWLSCLALGAIVLSFLLARLYKEGDALAWILLLYFCLCFTVIGVKWYLRLDLAMYDAEKYHQISAKLAGLLRVDFLGNLSEAIPPYAAYTLPLGLLYFLFGVSEPMGQLFNTLVGLGVIVNLHHLAGLWFNRRVADRTALLMALYPYGWVLSATLNRDMMIAFCITLFFRMLAALQTEEGRASKRSLFLAALASLLYMGLLRPPLLVLGALALFIYGMTYRTKPSRRHRLFRVARMILVILVVGVGSAGYLLFGKYYTATSHLEQQATQFSDVGSMNQRLRISEDAGSAYMKGVKYSSYQDVVRVMPQAAIYFLFSPFPWQVQSPKQALGLLDSLWLMAVWCYFLKGIKALYRRNRKLALALLAFLVVGVTTSGVLQANVGSAMRHRTMFSFLVFPLAMAGCLRSPRKVEVSLPMLTPMLPPAVRLHRG